MDLTKYYPDIAAKYTTTWRVTNKNAEPDSVMVNQTFGTKRKNAYEIFEDCLNMQSTTVRDRQEYINEKGNKSVKYVVNAQETMIARAKQQQIQEAFASWVWKEPERRDTVTINKSGYFYIYVANTSSSKSADISLSYAY